MFGCVASRVGRWSLAILLGEKVEDANTQRFILSNKKHAACVEMKRKTSRATLRTDSSFLAVTFNYLALTAVTTFMLQWRDIRSVKVKNNL